MIIKDKILDDLLQEERAKYCPYCQTSIRGHTWKNLNGKGTRTCKICENTFPEDREARKQVRSQIQQQRLRT
jgi:RNA polymerase subunit RPABC4/transcription elongation factor Spt4